MSRIGKMVIIIPSGVNISSEGRLVTVKGPKGELSHTLPEGLAIRLEEGNAYIDVVGESDTLNALHGLTRSLVNNMVIGVSTGFTKVLELHGVGYRVALKGSSLDFNIGKSHPTIFEAPKGITFVVEGQNKISVQGIDKQLVGQVAANIRMLKKPEPYKGKGIRYAGERILLKAGKTGKK